MADRLFPSAEELLDERFVAELLKDLSEANPGSARAKDPAGMLRVYRKHLAGISEVAARGAVNALIRGGTRGFPSVGAIREAAHEWNRRNRTSPEFIQRHDPNVCQSCRTAFVFASRYRPACDGRGAIRLTADRRAIILEGYARDVCACHPKCEYTPDISPEAEERYGSMPTMPLALVPEHTKLRILDQLANQRAVWRQANPAAPKTATAADTELRKLLTGTAA